MISVESAILRARRDLFISRALNALLIACAVAVLFLEPLLKINPIVALTVLGGLYAVLGMQSMRGSRLAADSPSLIASGQFDAAEAQIDGALRSFSIFRAVKYLSLHHLAALRHAQRRWSESAELCRALLSHTAVRRQSLARSTQLILADSLLEMDDLRGVGECIAQLYSQRLSLGEALNLMLVQLDYESRTGAWPSMMNGAPTKVSMSELLPAAQSAKAQALLALAARRSNRADWESWLRRRVELLIDPQELIVRRPILKELWIA